MKLGGTGRCSLESWTDRLDPNKAAKRKLGKPSRDWVLGTPYFLGSGRRGEQPWKGGESVIEEEGRFLPG